MEEKNLLMGQKLALESNGGPRALSYQSVDLQILSNWLSQYL